MQSNNWARRSVLKAMTLSAAGTALPSLAQPVFPQRPLRVVVGLPPGGAADAIARAIGQALEAEAKVPVVIENRPGGQFSISVNALLAQPADGYSLLYIYSGYVAIQATQGLFDLDKSVIPVARVATSPIVVLARGDAPYKSMKDMIAFARANNRKVNWGTFGEASLEHLKLAQIEQAGGFKVLPVPYKGGPDMVQALLGGEIDCCLVAGIFGKMHAPSGRVRVLAVLEPKRWDAFPEAPTLQEAGLDVAPLTYWGGYVVKAGTPPEIVERLAKMLGRAARKPEVVARIEGTGQLVDVDDNPEGFRRQIRADLTWITEAHKLLLR